MLYHDMINDVCGRDFVALSCKIPANHLFLVNPLQLINNGNLFFSQYELASIDSLFFHNSFYNLIFFHVLFSPLPSKNTTLHLIAPHHSHQIYNRIVLSVLVQSFYHLMFIIFPSFVR